ncbi:16S rRNA (uracil(1498)-N(3))-methyltransferase [Thalassotalea sp. LPB0316]|uniref:16S rRNA (uracil(1498)-N(3))-methyltransferase n=1 Tax=Thalassotalea sp. LPB0316 TaxID=2769490 RepID=UPI001867C0A0|nr:16S rRNA (uracil(1498)-N(3))-methyltransferase [Thalassotalea sp. LPB0316]QOL25685.1 16S rRNA (uracil(1498)-N(3))-methyltransferase [Thalassotalea sp. LPB0316]
MTNPRIYQDTPFIVGQTFELDDNAFGHVVRVLRHKEGDELCFFNGHDGIEYRVELTQVKKKTAFAQVVEQTRVTNESPLKIELGQGISRGDRMDFTLQKSVELGVSSITPLFTERCGVKLTGDRLAKKREQWQKIVISACEQSGRVYVPVVNDPIWLEEWLAVDTDALNINLHPRAQHSIMSLPFDSQNIRLLIGPEGGLSDEEINKASAANFKEVLLGPRVLRTETAALTAITALQCRYGDLG